VRLRHILVQQKYEAEDVLCLLKQGQDFGMLAKKWSTCSSSSAGGELGDLKGKKLDADFEDAASILKPGQTSGIIRTKFGYHIIRKEKKEE
jgi:parvulin-like peptidyl-prolyl isomerase